MGASSIVFTRSKTGAGYQDAGDPNASKRFRATPALVEELQSELGQMHDRTDIPAYGGAFHTWKPGTPLGDDREEAPGSPSESSR